MGSATKMTYRCHWTTSPLRYVLGRNPGSLPVGRDAGRARFSLLSAVVRPRSGGRSGDVNEIGARPSPVVRAWRRSAIPTSSRPPSDRGPQRRRSRLTTRPRREPYLTGLSLGGDEPAVFRLAAKRGTNEYRDRPRLVPRHSRLAPRSGAARVRMRVGCGSSLAFGARSRVRPG